MNKLEDKVGSINLSNDQDNDEHAKNTTMGPKGACAVGTADDHKVTSHDRQNIQAESVGVPAAVDEMTKLEVDAKKKPVKRSK